jgi:hypothetical protein
VVKSFLKLTKDLQIAGVGIFLTLAGAVIGMVWLSVALERALSGPVEPAGAPALVGIVFMLPLLIGLGILMAKRPSHAMQAAASSEHHGAIPQLSRAVRDLAQKSPLSAIALAALAGLLAARFPAALALLVQAFPLRDEVT